MSGRLAGKVAVVSGIGSGIGQGAALVFAAEGATVIGTDINPDSAGATGARAVEQGYAIEVQAPLDMLDAKAVEALMSGAVERYGGIDILVNAAAVVEFAWISDMTLEQWRRTMVGELDIVFLSCRAAWPHLVARGGGAIINFGSIAGYGATRSLPAIAHSAGKGGVRAMTKQLAMEGAPHRIRVNSISAGLIDSGSTREALDMVPGFRRAVEDKVMLDRLGRPEDAAWAATYLASDEATWVTGADLVVDGGMNAW